MLDATFTIPDKPSTVKQPGARLMQDVDLPRTVNLREARLVKLTEPKEGKVVASIILQRASRYPKLGQRHAELFLNAQDVIPEEWSDYEILFPGTIWDPRNGRRDIYEYVTIARKSPINGPKGEWVMHHVPSHGWPYQGAPTEEEFWGPNMAIVVFPG